MFEKILVCLDGSNLAEQILPYAIEEALHFNSKIVLLQVITPSSIAAPQEAHGSEWITEELNRLESQAWAYLGNVVRNLNKKGVDVEWMVVVGQKTGDTIVNFADKNNIDLIAIATHGRSGLGRTIFGSVADHVLREAGLPILVMKPK